MKYMCVCVPHDTRAVAHPGGNLHGVVSLGDQTADACMAAIVGHRVNAKFSIDFDAPHAGGPIRPNHQSVWLNDTMRRNARAHIAFATLRKVRPQIIGNWHGAAAVSFGAGDFAILGRNANNNRVVFHTVPTQRNGFGRTQTSKDHQRKQSRVSWLAGQGLKDACHVMFIDHGSFGRIDTQTFDAGAWVDLQSAIFNGRPKTRAEDPPHAVDRFGRRAIAQHIAPKILQNGAADFIQVVPAKAWRDVALKHIGTLCHGAGLPCNAVDGNPARGPRNQTLAVPPEIVASGLDCAFHVGGKMPRVFFGSKRACALLAIFAPRHAPGRAGKTGLVDGSHACIMHQMLSVVVEGVVEPTNKDGVTDAINDETPLSEQGFGNGRYRARTCDPQLVELDKRHLRFPANPANSGQNLASQRVFAFDPSRVFAGRFGVGVVENVVGRSPVLATLRGHEVPA